MKSLFKSIFKSDPDIRFLKRIQQAIEEGIAISAESSLTEFKYIVTLLMTAALLVACSSSHAGTNGQVRGVLVDKEGHPFVQKVDVFIGKIDDEASGKINLDTTLQSPIDNSGAFQIKDVPPGKYVLMLFFKLRGGFGVVLKKDKPFTFEVSQEGDIDLGEVDASQIRSL